MTRYLTITSLALILAAPFVQSAEENAAATAETDAAAAEPDYVERLEKVKSAATGRMETERVIEFKGTEIAAELAKPVSFIIPRAKPDFNHITLTIYNNEPSAYAPEDYKMSYYRRVPVRDEAAADKSAHAEFAAPTPGESTDGDDKPPAVSDQP